MDSIGALGAYMPDIKSRLPDWSGSTWAGAGVGGIAALAAGIWATPKAVRGVVKCMQSMKAAWQRPQKLRDLQLQKSRVCTGLGATGILVALVTFVAGLALESTKAALAASVATYGFIAGVVLLSLAGLAYLAYNYREANIRFR